MTTEQREKVPVQARHMLAEVDNQNFRSVRTSSSHSRHQETITIFRRRARDLANARAQNIHQELHRRIQSHDTALHTKAFAAQDLRDPHQHSADPTEGYATYCNVDGALQGGLTAITKKDSALAYIRTQIERLRGEAASATSHPAIPTTPTLDHTQTTPDDTLRHPTGSPIFRSSDLRPSRHCSSFDDSFCLLNDIGSAFPTNATDHLTLPYAEDSIHHAIAPVNTPASTPPPPTSPFLSPFPNLPPTQKPLTGHLTHETTPPPTNPSTISVAPPSRDPVAYRPFWTTHAPPTRAAETRSISLYSPDENENTDDDIVDLYPVTTRCLSISSASGDEEDWVHVCGGGEVGAGGIGNGTVVEGFAAVFLNSGDEDEFGNLVKGGGEPGGLLDDVGGVEGDEWGQWGW